MMDWTNTKAEWDGEDWRFTEVPLEACPNWGGRTCFSRMELNYEGADPKVALAALQYWVEHGESWGSDPAKSNPVMREGEELLRDLSQAVKDHGYIGADNLLASIDAYLARVSSHTKSDPAKSNPARVVINTQGHNLGLEPTDMGMILSRIPGWTTQAKGKVTRGSSEDCWFYDGQGNRVDWVQFRAHPALVALVLEGAMPSKLKCVEIPKGTEFYIKQPTEWERGNYGDNYKGEVVVQCASYEWV